MRSQGVERVFVIFSNVVNKDVGKLWVRAQEEMRADPGCFLSLRDPGSILKVRSPNALDIRKWSHLTGPWPEHSSKKK